MTFNFLHFSIQEFLAAHHVSSLSPCDELKILKEKFWSDIHFNMFGFYMALTKGQRPSFRRFIKPSWGEWITGLLTGHGVQVANEFLDDKVKCFHLFRCFLEAGDNEMCRSIENAKTFNSKIINLARTRLSPSDVECLTVFLTCSSHTKWIELDLRECYIQDQGVHILHRGLTSCNVTIQTLRLRFNGITESSSSAISDITICCRVKALDINGNKIVGEDKRLYSIISDPSSMLEELYMYNKSSSNAAIKLFTALSQGKKLRTLGITYNSITDEACDAIIMAMKNNTSLVGLYMYDNPISEKCVQLIVEALQHNNTLQILWLPYGYSENTRKRIILLAEEVNKKRESCECRVKLEINYWD